MVLKGVATLAIAGMVSVPALSGCGTDQRESGATEAANRFVSTLDQPAQACALLSPETLEALESQGEPCEQALTSLDLPRGRATEASVWSGRAQVHTDADTLFLVELDAGWRVVAAGCRHETEENYRCALAD
jgi:hypothetical protein